ncbi:PucR family transcriptional regulator [Trujillonella humicola]|uniref:PucR family transcriptional regulator n=1 Tax=Trujillonella humicola TaxID=3383699 RepID=UPI00390691C9
MDAAPETIASAHGQLVRSSLQVNGPRGIAECIKSTLRCWVLVLDGEGALQANVPESARIHAPRVRTELPRFTAPSHLGSISLASPTEVIMLRPVVAAGRTRAFLAIGRATPLDPVEMSLFDTSTLLLAAELTRADEARTMVRKGRHAVLNLLLEGQPEAAQSVADVLDVPCPRGPVRVALLGAPREYGPELIDTTENDRGLRRLATVISEDRPGRVVVVLPTAEGDLRTLEAVLQRVPHSHGTVSDSIPIAELPGAWRRVNTVFQLSARQTGKLLLAKDIADAGLLRHLAGDDVRAWAQAALAPILALDEGSKVDFLHTLRVLLAHNGQSDASATELDIHRHTLRYRMGRIAEALGRDLDDVTVRAELWFAMQLNPR